MKKWVYANIYWLTAEKGGRNQPVPVAANENNKYCPIIRFPGTMTEYDNWSAEVYFDSQVSEHESRARVSYLFENAPFELLSQGAVFELYEGNRLVATGEII